MKKICFITATRAEYGLLKYLMKEVDQSDVFQLQVIVTGAHLMEEQGYTINQIKEDGICIDRTVDANIDTATPTTIAESMGRMAQLFPQVFEELSPDYVVVLGDRYELLPICNSAFVMGVPIIHIAGGDVTEGAIDDGIRNAITMLATYHFPGTKDSAENVIRMRGSNVGIWEVGETNIDVFRIEEKIDRSKLASDLNMNVDKKWILFTYHAETKQSLEYNMNAVRNCMNVLMSMDDVQIIATYSNADYGGKFINEYLESIQRRNKEKIRVIPSLGSKRYVSLMREVILVIGNSSSGIEETPMAKVATVNMGSRQKGRHLCSNIIQCDSIDEAAIKEAVMCGINNPVDLTDIDYWGDGYASRKIISILENNLG